MIPFQKLDDLPLGLRSADAMAVLEPFIRRNATPEERRKFFRHLQYRTLRRAIDRTLGLEGGKRDKAVILAEYEEAWTKGYLRYDVSAGCVRPDPWDYRGQPMLADRAGIARFRSVILGRVIETLKPRNVLEVGCGNGINLLLLAGAFPDVEFTGLELTEAGHRGAVELQKAAALPPNLTAYAPLPQRDPTAFRHINFVRGDATRMPFADRSFELVFTVLSVEQMERVREAALSDIARVAKDNVLNLEPFAEANGHGWKRLNVYARNYFRGRIADLPRYGLEPQWATDDFPQEAILGTALVLSAKAQKA